MRGIIVFFVPRRPRHVVLAERFVIRGQYDLAELMMLAGRILNNP